MRIPVVAQGLDRFLVGPRAHVRAAEDGHRAVHGNVALAGAEAEVVVVPIVDEIREGVVIRSGGDLAPPRERGAGGLCVERVGQEGHGEDKQNRAHGGIPSTIARSPTAIQVGIHESSEGVQERAGSAGVTPVEVGSGDGSAVPQQPPKTPWPRASRRAPMIAASKVGIAERAVVVRAARRWA